MARSDAIDALRAEWTRLDDAANRAAARNDTYTEIQYINQRTAIAGAIQIVINFG